MIVVDEALAALDRALAGATPEAKRALLAGVMAWTAARLVGTIGVQAQLAAVEDDLLDVPQAAERLKVAPDWIYRRSKSLPFMVRLGPRVLRCSAARLDRYIRQRQRGA